MSPPELRRLSTKLRSAANRTEWSAARHARAIYTAAVLRACERHLAAPRSRREKVARGRWLVHAVIGGESAPAISLVVPVVRKTADFRATIELEILQPALVDVRGLATWCGQSWTGVVKQRFAP